MNFLLLSIQILNLGSLVVLGLGRLVSMRVQGKTTMEAAVAITIGRLPLGTCHEFS